MKMDKHILIGKVNDTEIFAISNNADQYYVPICTVCKAFGLDVDTQLRKMSDDELLMNAMEYITVADNDGACDELLGVSVRMFPGLAMMIDPDDASDESRNDLICFQEKCNEVLYNHFTNRKQDLETAERKAIADLSELDELVASAESNLIDLRALRLETQDVLDKIRSSRLDDQPTLFD